MGPAASANFLTRLVAAVPAERDQDHPRIVVDSDPSVPDRTEAILGRGPDPVQALRTMCARLEQAGAQHLLMPCNTAHHFLPQLRQDRTADFVDMVAATADAATLLGSDRIGLLATDGTVETGLYDTALTAHGLTVVLPDPTGQSAVMRAVRLVKAGRTEEALMAVDDPLRALAEGDLPVLLGCTELSVLFHAHPTTIVRMLDPLDVLVEEGIRRTYDPWCASCGSSRSKHLHTPYD